MALPKDKVPLLDDAATVLFEAMPFPVVISAQDDTSILYANRRALEALELAHDEILIYHALDFWNDPEQRKQIAAALERQQEVKDVEGTLRLPKGTLLEGILSFAKVLFRGREAVLASFNDITQVKAMAGRLRESEQRYRLLAENVHDVIWTMDFATLKFTYVSPSIQQLRGLTVEEAMNESLADSLTEESLERARKIMTENRAKQPSPTISDVFRQPCKDGSIKQVEITVSVVHDAGGRPVSYVGVSRDVTERVEAQLARDQVLEELKRALEEVRVLSGFIPICSHCKRVRDDQGYWTAVEAYVTQHSKAQFTHGICPKCFAEHYPDSEE